MTTFLQPPSVLQIGPPGSGKTSALGTQLLAGLEVFVIMTEPDGTASLIDACERLKAPIDKLHWTTCLPSSAGWSGLEDMINKINSMDQKGLADMKDMGKAGFRDAAMRLLNAFRNFHCERTGNDYGDMSTWDDTRSMNIDSLTGWSHIAFGATVGYKPTANPGEWGIAQNFIANWLLKIHNSRRCWFSMTAHVEKEMDEISGVKKIMVSTIGSKLAPKIPTFFSEVVKSYKSGDQFYWATTEMGMDLKNRALKVGDKLPPDWRPIMEVYKHRKVFAGEPAPSGVVPPPKVMVPPSAPMTPHGVATQK